jgi:sugar/nucleoside kinase (ribokinase family)
LADGIFVGLSTLDVVYVVDEFPQANTKVAALTQEVFAGGPATNAAFAFAHLGGMATLVTAVGRHAMAGPIKAEFRQHAIHLIDLNADFADAPVISSISVNKSGERNVVSANAVRVNVPAARVDRAALAGAAVVLVDGHYMEACQAWTGAARARGVPVVLDGGSWKEGTGELLRNVDTAICSNDFMPPGCAMEDDVIRYLSDCGVGNIAITHGASPIRFHTRAASGQLPVPRIEPLDTMGAGDIFHGAFCYFASSGKGFASALAEAAKIASESCRFRGTREWMHHTGS